MREMNLAMIPEGPLAFDGEDYLYSEGEGLYIDGLAGYFEEIIICAYAFHKGEPGYETVCNYHFKSSNLRFIELPHWSAGNAGIFSKFMQFVRVCISILADIRNWDVIYLFLPGFPAAFTYLINKFFNKKYFVYLASEWSEEAELLFPWEGIKKKLLLPYQNSEESLLRLYLRFHASARQRLFFCSRLCGYRQGPSLCRKELWSCLF